MRALTAAAIVLLSACGGKTNGVQTPSSLGGAWSLVIVTVWESLDAVRAFAGDDVAVAVVPEVARNMMVRFDPRVAHYEPVEGGEP